MVRIPMAGRSFERRATPYSLWMAQRVLDAYRNFGFDQRAAADPWLASVGGASAMRLPIRPRLRRMALHVAPE
jgi:hypothetical protein